MRARRTGGGRGRRPLLLVPFAALLLALLLVPRTGFAHAQLLETSPAEGARAEGAVTALLLRFSEPVELLALRLLDSSGQDHAAGLQPAVNGGEVTLALPAPLAERGYLVSWRVVSLDGHVIAGSFGFSVGDAAAGAPGAAVEAESWRWPAFALRAFSRLALLLAAGSGLFLLLVPAGGTLRPGLSRLARRLAFAALPLALLGWLAGGAERAGVPPEALFSGLGDSLLAAVSAPAFWAWGLTLLGILLLAFPVKEGLRSLGALLVPAVLATSGHGLLLWSGWGGAVMWLHGLAAAAWMGAFLPLRRALAAPAPEARLVFARFQTLGLAAVLALLGSGLAVMLSLLPTLSLLWTSDYGLRLLAKLALVLVMLAIAAGNRLALTRRALAGREASRALLRRLLLLDLLLAGAVVVLAASLSLDPPVRQEGLRVTLASPAYRIELTLEPGRIGDNRGTLRIATPAGEPADPQAVALRIAAEAAGIEPATLPARRLAPGVYALDHLPLWVAGPWSLRADLLLDSFTQLHGRGEVTLD